MNISDVAALPGARLIFGSADAAISGVSTDTRDADFTGCLYIALKGEKQDGHAYLDAAVEKGVACVMIESRGVAPARRLRDEGKVFAAVVVPDTLAGLQELARRHRSRLDVKIAAITGSNGKTSAKDFTGAIVSNSYRAVVARLSFNNHIGVPMTILRMKPDTQVGILEMGMNHPGEIAALCRIADPDLVAITSVSSAHAGAFRTVRHIAQAKSEILTASRAGIPAFLPADSDQLPFLRRKATGKHVVTFGVAKDADWRVMNVVPTVERLRFTVRAPHPVSAAPRGSAVYRCPNFGEHQLTNVLLSVAIASAFAVPFKKIQSAISRLVIPPGRGEVVKLGSHILVNDSYNANPASMAASLQRMRGLKTAMNRRTSSKRYESVLVMGDMLELGRSSASFHRRLGEQAAAAKPWKVIFTGTQGEFVRKGYVSAGGRKEDFEIVEKADDVRSKLDDWMSKKPRIIVLVKASHSVNLDRVVRHLRQNT